MTERNDLGELGGEDAGDGDPPLDLSASKYLWTAAISLTLAPDFPRNPITTGSKIPGQKIGPAISILEYT